MLIGLDFDNTIAGYDAVFSSAAVRDGLLAPGEAATKLDVRARLRERPGGETDWMRLQGRVYGAYMGDAVLIDGVADFFTACRKAGAEVRIVSHKTEFGHFDSDRVNLRDAAMDWMAAKRFFDADGFGLAPEHVSFAATREAKARRIAEIGCTHFVDDLVEVFDEPNFPTATLRYLYHPGADPAPAGPFTAFSDWRALGDELFGPRD